jgi:hypothetical protein
MRIARVLRRMSPFTFLRPLPDGRPAGEKDAELSLVHPLFHTKFD